MVALNKTDAADPATLAELEAAFAEEGVETLRLSGATGAGRDAVLDAIVERLTTPTPAVAPVEPGAWSPL